MIIIICVSVSPMGKTGMQIYQPMEDIIMPIMQVFLIEGRTAEQKQKLISALTEAAVTSINAPRDSVRVLLTEVPKENFGIAGQTALSLGR